MQYTPSFVIYNASAGSGKTYGLVKAYLKIVLSSKNADSFRNLLAITFTNKAVFEMKNRIVETLMKFANPKVLTEKDTMFESLCEELQLSPAELHKRSDLVLKHILHNYAAFAINTIDGFNHRLIRSFAFDLQINQFFEIQLDRDTILQRAIDNLSQQIGEDNELTELLTEFSKNQIDEDRNWDISQELFEVAKMITEENHYEMLKSLKTKTAADFLALKSNLYTKRKDALNSIKECTHRFFELLNHHRLDENTLIKHLYNFFDKLKNEPDKVPSFGLAWQLNLENNPLYTKTNAKKKNFNTALIDSLQPEIVTLFETIKTTFHRIDFYNNALKNIIPLALLNRLQNEIELIKEEENILPIWEFNGVISNEITSQPAPFIYERIGERYRHYFIDEFQDTSVLQWENFIPLIFNAVQSENNYHQKGSLLLVGDAKQSIYRWRGGKAEQFMALYSGDKNPFFVEGLVFDLEENHRSLPEIINFNNHLFGSIAPLFETEKYRNLYGNSKQNYPQYKKEKSLPSGYINIRFLDLSDDQTEEQEDAYQGFSPKDLHYCQATLEAVENANSNGAQDKDICILTRRNKEAIKIATYLSSKNRNVISSQSLLLQNVASIQFLISLLKVMLNRESKERKLAMLLAYAELYPQQNTHEFLSKFLDAPFEAFLQTHHFSWEQFKAYSLFEGITYAIASFGLAKKSDAYVAQFLDLIFDFKNGRKGGLSDFLAYWDEHKEELSINSPEGTNAITIMTVHKSKGLSAPVIIFAYADVPLISVHKNTTVWYPVLPGDFSGFSYLRVKAVKSLYDYEDHAKQLMIALEEQELLDNTNVLYVALTRPESFLYIISSLPKQENRITYGTLLKDHLSDQKVWDDEVFTYDFGKPIFPKKEETKTENKNPTIPFQQGWKTPNYKIAKRSAMLWDTPLEKSIAKGNVIHELMAQISITSDLDFVLAKACDNGTLSQEQHPIVRQQLSTVMHHPELQVYFTDAYQYFNEREFLDGNGNYFRPDRIALLTSTQEAVIIDYKTGKSTPKYIEQINYYAQQLEDLGWHIAKKFLVFIDDEVVVERI